MFIFHVEMECTQSDGISTVTGLLLVAMVIEQSFSAYMLRAHLLYVKEKQRKNTLDVCMEEDENQRNK